MKFLCFNPSYKLRQDGNRVILYGDDDDEYDAEDWYSYIHPYHAMMFSFFKGKDPREAENKRFADYFGISENDATKIVDSYIADERKTIHVHDKCYFFPKNTLIERDVPFGNVSSFDYSASDFKYLGEPDIYSMRASFPVSINMELTMKCYVDCCYCYANRCIQKNGQMSTEEVVKFIKYARKAGVLNLDINGGEVLLHPGIVEIVKTLYECGYKPLISTKMPVDAKMLEELKSWGMRNYQISLDAANDNVLHELINSKQGYLKSIRKTLQNSEELGLKVNINTVLTNINCDVKILRELFDFINQFNCVKTVRLNVCGYSLYKDNYKKIRPSQHQVFEVEEFINSGIRDTLKFRIVMAGYDKADDYCQEKRASIFEDRAICTGNLRNLVVLPNGDVTICEELYDNPHFLIGNILQSSLEEIWNSEKARNLLYNPCNRKSNSNCTHCDSYQSCRPRVGVCWKTVLMAYGKENWDYPDPRCPKGPQPYNEFFIR